uniref:CKLF-like MARVEL transmembrane domain-containing protein 4 n=1 Tax=Myxine glutinosa TaxID=7769 RepID=UPI00358FD643
MASGTSSEPHFGEAQTPLADRPYQPTTEPAVRDPPGSSSKAYLRSINGLLKIAQVVTSFIAFICVEVVDRCRNCKALYFFEFVSCSVFLISFSLLIIFCFRLNKRFSAINWKLTDEINALLATLFLLIACIVLAVKNSGNSAEIAAVVFGFFALFLFLGSSFLVLLEWKQRAPWSSRSTSSSGPNHNYSRTRSDSHPEQPNQNV